MKTLFTKFQIIVAALLYSNFILSQVPLGGIKTIDPNGVGVNNYTNFVVAVNALNANGVAAGGVTFNVVPNAVWQHTICIDIPNGGLRIDLTGLSPSLQSNSTQPVVFRKTPGLPGANPRFEIGINYGGNPPLMGTAFGINGTDYLTFDGIDVYSWAAPNGVGNAFWIHRASVTDGVQNLIIKNCTIDLNLSNFPTKTGISIEGGGSWCGTGCSYVASSVSGIHQDLFFYSNIIRHCYAGIRNFAGITGLYDEKVSIGVDENGNAAGNTILEYKLWGVIFGSGTSARNLRVVNNNISTSGTNPGFTGDGIRITSTSNNYTYAILNNTVTVVSTATTGTVNGIWLGGASTVPNDSIQVCNNLVQNCALLTTSAQVHFRGIALTGFTNKARVSGNQVLNNYNTCPFSGATHYGIQIAPSSSLSVMVIANDISGNTSVNGELGGIVFTQLTGTANVNGSVYQNEVSALTNSVSSTAIARGIYLSQQTAGTLSLTVHNNFVANIKAPASTSAIAVAGVMVGSNTNLKLYFNSIKLSAASTGAGFGSAGIYVDNSGTGTILDSRNNLVVNASTPGAGGLTVAFRAAVSTNTYLAASSNRNSFYVNAPGATSLIYYDGANAFQSLATYTPFMAPREANSISTNPVFASLNDLHTNDPVVLGMAAPIVGITTDIDPQSRPNPPAVGADEPLMNYLPIESVSFSGTCKEDGTVLNWSIDKESECDHYVLESSDDMEEFRVISTIKAKQAKSEQAEYSFTDRDTHHKEVYYRLNKVYKSGVTKKVGFTNMNCARANANDFKLFPNPASNGDGIFLELPQLENENYSCSVLDLSGKVISSQNDLAPGKQQLNASRDLAPGIYLINISSSKNNYHSKLIIR